MSAEDWIPWDAELFDEDEERGPFWGSRSGYNWRESQRPTDWIMTPTGWAKAPATIYEFEDES